MKHKKHTPGPWIIEGDSMDGLISTPFVCDEIIVMTGGLRTQADTHLIAAAPDLLVACKCALADLEGIMPEYESSGDRTHPAWVTIEELKQVISKAEGR